MSRLPTAFTLAIGQLGDPRVLRVLGKSLGVTLAIFLAFGWAGSLALDHLFARYGIAGEWGGLVAALVTVLAGWLLFRIVALAVLQFFADEVVEAIEARHYPAQAAAARKLPLREELSISLRSAGRALVVNLAALPFALALLVTGFGTALLFWVVNAVLLGRELQDMVWLRHRPSVGQVAPLGRLERFVLGGAVAALLIVPLVNLLAPVLGAAAATHLIHRRPDRHRELSA